MNMNITEPGNYQTVGKSAAKPLFVEFLRKERLKLLITVKAEIFHKINPRNLSGISYRLKTTTDIIANAPALVNGFGRQYYFCRPTRIYCDVCEPFCRKTPVNSKKVPDSTVVELVFPAFKDDFSFAKRLFDFKQHGASL